MHSHTLPSSAPVHTHINRIHKQITIQLFNNTGMDIISNLGFLSQHFCIADRLLMMTSVLYVVILPQLVM